MTAKILIVDDEPKMVKLLRFALDAEGYQTLVATRGEEAIRILVDESPDLIILDVMLPGTSGLEICEQIRSKSETANLPIILLSALASVADKVKGLEAGADEYVTKPVDPVEICARVAALLARVERLRRAEPKRRGVVLNFVGAKGGVGTTTVAVNMGVALAKRQKSVVTVDLRPTIGTTCSLLGLSPKGDLGYLQDLDPGKISQEVVERCLCSHPTGLRLLSAPQSIGKHGDLKPESVKSILMALGEMADWIVLDLPSNASEANHIALQNSACAVVIMSPIASCLEPAKAMVEFIRACIPSGAIVGTILVNRYGFTRALTKQETESELGCPVLGAIPLAAEALFSAQEVGQPITLMQPESVASMAMFELADLLLGQLA